jgi:hypothetical protein
MKTILFFLLATNSICFAQLNSIVDFVYLLETDNNIGSNGVYIYNDSVYSIVENDDFFVVRNMKSGSNQKFIIPDSIPFRTPENFCICNDILCYYDWDAVHCFTFPEGEYLISVDYDACPRGMKGIENKIYLYGVTYCGVIDNYNQSAVTTIDFTEKTIETKFFPNPSASGFSFFQPSNVMDVDENQVYLADYDKYRILIYDHNGKLLDSIKRDPAEWVMNTGIIPKYPLGSNEPVKYIKSIIPYAEKISHMNNIKLVGKDKLFVHWSIPTGDRYDPIMRFDLWEKKGDEWILSVSDIKDASDNSNTKLTQFSLQISFDCRVVNNYLLILSSGATKKLFEKYQGKTYGEFQEACDEYFLDHDLKSLIGVYKFK